MGQLAQFLTFKTSVQPGREVKRNQPALLVLTDGHVVQHPHQDLAEGTTRLAATTLRVLGPVKVAHFEVGLGFAALAPAGKPGPGLTQCVLIFHICFHSLMALAVPVFESQLFQIGHCLSI